MLAGVGIAFKLAQALKQSRPDQATYQDADLLDLVAIGTVADLAPCSKKIATGHRRPAITQQPKRAGIAAIARAARLTLATYRPNPSPLALARASTLRGGWPTPTAPPACWPPATAATPIITPTNWTP
ncbi:MAG: hypothetical protein H6656_07220 [Ardenticatenaceae bacterium]|nr:hypothetical protein [Ardenticatenaceae bacterium]